MILSKLLSSLPDYQIFGDLSKDISSIVSDSRQVKKGCLFVAIKGFNFDAHDFIPDVVGKGVAAVVGENIPDKKILSKTTYIKVKNSREALGLIASVWYGKPSERLKVIGVTGTDGKTTTVNIIYHLLKTAGKKVGMVSSVNARIGKRVIDTGFHVTNPDQLLLQKLLSDMVKDKCEYAVVEVTSHGLDQERVAGVKFYIGVLTNITHEHLDYHKTYINYLKTKVKLLLNSNLAVINQKDDSFKQVSGMLKSRVNYISYDESSLPKNLIKIIKKTFSQTYNWQNAIVAITVVRKLGISDEIIMKNLGSFPGVEGRMEEIKNKKGIKIIIDFAHTPNALENVLGFLKSESNGRVIAVFGCAGERDIKKRQKMGEIAAKYADVIVVTAEDPRSEKIKAISAEIIEGISRIASAKYYLIPERGEAISFAINKVARKGDRVVITGKGHEKSMCYGKTEYPWSDHEAVKMALEGEVLHLRGGRLALSEAEGMDSSDGEDIKMNVHFMGIGGSGIAGVAELAQKSGYTVSGCDLQGSTFYSKQLKGIKVLRGHSVKHLQKQDLLVVSPAILYQGKDQEEFKKAKSVMTWQEFLGKQLLKNKKVIAISGTHGKSTTTAMAGLIFEKAGYDPGVMVGAMVKEWKSSYRYGKGDKYIVEADEFNDNFLNYSPETIIINNIEFDHPDYFKNKGEVFNSFKKFVTRLSGKKNLIVNEDSPGVQKLLQLLGDEKLKQLNFKGYSLKRDVKDINLGESISAFDFEGQKYKLKTPGLHNISNALGVIILGKIYGIESAVIQKILNDFEGVGRRMDLLGDINGIKVYDDYAHHPTAIKATLEALRQKHPEEKIWAIYEPHSYSRTRALLKDYEGVFSAADRVIIAPIFKARDESDFGVSEESVVKSSNHKNIESHQSFNEVIIEFLKDIRSGDVVIVMGAGNSYLLAREVTVGLRFCFDQKDNIKITIGKKLSEYTTADVGGPARFFIEVNNDNKLIRVVEVAKKYKMPYIILGGGSNLLVSDSGYSGLVIKNSCRGIRTEGNRITVKAGELLQNLIDEVIEEGLSGIENMSWIPGTVGGAIYGNAGAYGQTISDCLNRVKILDGEKIRWISKGECKFYYRGSVFKSKDWVILEAEFKFQEGDKSDLRKRAGEIIRIRKEKFPDGMKCPGSYFKNIIVKDLPCHVLKVIPPDKIVYGKVPAGYLLEAVGARGKRLGSIEVAKNHGNMFVNKGGGRARDCYSLASFYAKKVEKKFGIKLEPEVQLIGFES